MTGKAVMPAGTHGQGRGLRRQIEAMADRGVPTAQIVAGLGCNAEYAAYVLKFWRIERTGKDAGDRTQPRFAHHAEHVLACLAVGGFPSWSEKRPGGFAVPPLRWPEVLT